MKLVKGGGGRGGGGRAGGSAFSMGNAWVIVNYSTFVVMLITKW